MSRSRAELMTAPRRTPAAPGRLRLDLLPNPYGPSIHVQEMLASSDDLHLPAGDRETRFHLRLASVLKVPADWLVLANGIDELLSMILLWRRENGPLVLFPPHDPSDTRRATQHGLDVVSVPRAGDWTLGLNPERIERVPMGGTALVTSPNDPTGTILGSQDAIRLTRRCDLVVVDERHGEYSARTMVPFVRECDNLIVLRTFETWAGLSGLPLAFAVAPPKLAAELVAFRRAGGLATSAIIAATATLNDFAYVRATVRRVREERSRLYRMLRKLNMVSCPYPSWANFLLVRVERGDSETISRELARRDIQVYPPPQPELANHLRISATCPESTHALKLALIEIALSL
ncbi:MAG: aminotransferase class I/II-fold pyridoxal phosphate-dependent enzyme [Chloroflexota bacterium]|nr:aminotransferase class I/II-fold pyridoxal phosphate-dependent enzyme [Chloroflexota bacterium]